MRTSPRAGVPADQRVAREDLDGFPDCRGRLRCRCRIPLGHEPDRALDVVEGAARIDYLRQGAGRRGLPPWASRSSQA